MLLRAPPERREISLCCIRHLPLMRVIFAMIRHLRPGPFIVQSCVLSLRELPPLQSGHSGLMSAISVAFGADGITSMRNEAFSGLHAPVIPLWEPHSLSFSG